MNTAYPFGNKPSPSGNFEIPGPQPIPLDHPFSRKLITVDRKCDYALGVSTITNFFDFIFILGYKLTSEKNQPRETNPFYRHLNEKGIKRCIIGMIPLLGNIILYAFDQYYWKSDRFYFLSKLEQGENRPFAFLDADQNLSENEEFILDAIQINKIALDIWPSARDMSWSPEFMQKAIEVNPQLISIKNLHKDLLNNKEFMLKAMKIDKNAYELAGSSLKKDLSFILEAMKINKEAFNLIYSLPEKEKEELLYKEDFMLEAIKLDKTLLKKTDLQFKPEFVLEVIKNDISALEYTPLKDFPVFMKEAMKINSKAQYYSNCRREWDRVLELIRQDVHLLQNEPIIGLRSNIDFMREAVEINRDASEYFGWGHQGFVERDAEGTWKNDDYDPYREWRKGYQA